MGIKREPLSFDGQFAQIPNSWLRDRRLSRRARGLLAELMSHQVGWTVNLSSLEAAGPEGREALQSAVRELKTHGYLRIEQGRSEESNKFGEVHYVVCEPDSVPVYGFPVERENRSTAFPADGKSDPKNTRDQEDHQEEHDGAVVEVDLPKGTRSPRGFPNPFTVTRDMREWASLRVPSVDVDEVTQEFVAYWRVGEGAGKRKKNWTLTWQTWLRRVHSRNVERGWVAPVRSVPVLTAVPAWVDVLRIPAEEYLERRGDVSWVAQMEKLASERAVG